jgi:hypothetical protein
MKKLFRIQENISLESNKIIKEKIYLNQLSFTF